MGLGNIGPSLCYAAASTLPVVCSIMVALRFYCRKTREIYIGWDDWLVLPALVALIGMSVAILTGLALHGVGYPAPAPQNGHSTGPSKQQIMTHQIVWVVYLLGPILITSVKVSFVLWYRRLFWQGSSKWYRATIWTVLLILIAWGTSFFMAYLFICPGHPSAYWGATDVVLAKCNKTTEVYEAYSLSDTILDVVVFVLPMVPLYNLQISAKKRLGVICIFMLGALSIIASMLRLLLIWTASPALYKPGTNMSGLLTSGMYWGLVEGGVALISCCLPPCSVLFKKKTYEHRDSMSTRTTRSDRLLSKVFSYRHASIDEKSVGLHSRQDGSGVSDTDSARQIHSRWGSIQSYESGVSL